MKNKMLLFRMATVFAVMMVLIFLGVSRLQSATATPANGVSLFDGKTLNGWLMFPPNSWIVKDGAMASTGAGRGYIYSVNDYTNYRLMFTMRHVSGNKDHQACILIFCIRPVEGQKALDALGGVQLQVPNGGHWDYRKGHNNGGAGEFTSPPHPKFDVHQWSRIEVLVNADAGTARMAVAQPVGAKAVEVLDFKVPGSGLKGPFSWQIHNAGLFDEYKDVQIEVNPTVNDLITTK
jgi:hypothetical protein